MIYIYIHILFCWNFSSAFFVSKKINHKLRAGKCKIHDGILNFLTLYFLVNKMNEWEFQKKNLSFVILFLIQFLLNLAKLCWKQIYKLSIFFAIKWCRHFFFMFQQKIRLLYVMKVFFEAKITCFLENGEIIDSYNSPFSGPWLMIYSYNIFPSGIRTVIVNTHM